MSTIYKPLYLLETPILYTDLNTAELIKNVTIEVDNSMKSLLAISNIISSSSEGAYRPLKPIFKTIYSDKLHDNGIATVDAINVRELNREPEKVYQPGHPKADEDGYIYMAAVNTEEELVEMLEASRQYENNVEVVSTLRGLMMRTISMGK